MKGEYKIGQWKVKFMQKSQFIHQTFCEYADFKLCDISASHLWSLVVVPYKDDRIIEHNLQLCFSVHCSNILMVQNTAM